MNTPRVSRAIAALILVLAALLVATPSARADDAPTPPTPEARAAACVQRIAHRTTLSVERIEQRATAAAEIVSGLLADGHPNAAQAAAQEAIERVTRRAVRTARHNHEDAGRCAIRLVQQGRPGLAGTVLAAAAQANGTLGTARSAAVAVILAPFGG